MSPDKTNISSIPMPLPDREAVVDAARSWIGTRWVHQGRTPLGVDCAGLVIKVHDMLGLEAEDMQGYRRTPNANTFLEHIRRQTTPAPEPRPGSLGIFKETRVACHVGIFAWHPKYDCLSLIHAHAAHKKVVEEPFTKDWFFNLVECRDLIGLRD